MKTELEVARDAVRAALGDDLADALEWAAAAVSMKPEIEAALRRLREFEAHFGYGPVDEAVRRGSALARADATDAMTYAIENITASQAAARRAERLRCAAELLSRADPGRLTYSAGTAQFWPTPDRNALLSATLEPPPLVHQMALAPGPEGVARCGEPNPVWPAGRAQVTCPRCFTLIAARTDART